MIRIEHLTKRFDKVDAVKDVSLEIPEGIMYGLLGTNGAGKSTLLRLIAGILQADEGRIEIEGDSCYDNPKCKSCFFLFAGYAVLFSEWKHGNDGEVLCRTISGDGCAGSF